MKNIIHNKQNIYSFYHLIDYQDTETKEIITICNRTIKDLKRFKITARKPHIYICPKCLSRLITRYYTI